MHEHYPGMIPDALCRALRDARHVVAMTGAGMSAESGVPTFRDAQTGMWARFRPEELATPQAFRRDPRRVWEWYAWRRELVARAAPHAGHGALVELERRAKRFTLITQNVDGLHRRAGSARVLELHGNLERSVCSAERTVMDSWQETGEVPPRCPRCGAPLRPDVVWFGEPLPQAAITEAFAAAAECDVFLCIGTSAQVQPAASLPVEALARGAAVVEVNPEPTPLTAHATHVLAGAAATVLPALLRAVRD